MSAQLQTVVIVDDDASMKEAMERLLNAAGYQSFGFACAEDAMRSAESAVATCLVLDIHLPGWSGIELYERIATTRRVPVVFITAYDDKETRDLSQQSGAAEFLVKPFEGRSLISAVQRAIGSGGE